MKTAQRMLALVVLVLTSLVTVGCMSLKLSDAMSSEAHVDRLFQRGYIDKSGRVVIRAEYYDVSDFSDGLALAVTESDAVIIDTKGAVVARVKPDLPAQVRQDAEKKGLKIWRVWVSHVEPFYEGLAAVTVKVMGYNAKEYYCPKLTGYVDTKGKWALLPVAEKASRFSDGWAFVHPASYAKRETVGSERTVFAGVKIISDGRDFSEGFAAIQRIAPEGKWQYVDTKFHEVTPPTFDDARDFHDGMAAVKTDEMWGYIDTKGRLVIPARFDEAGDFAEGLAPVKVGGSWGYVDKTGKVVVPFQFHFAQCFSEGRAAVEEAVGWGYIDATGKFVIPAIYEWAYQFSEGVAIVETQDVDSGPDVYDIIDVDGRVLAKGVQASTIGPTFHNGLASIGY